MIVNAFLSIARNRVALAQRHRWQPDHVRDLGRGRAPKRCFKIADQPAIRDGKLTAVRSTDTGSYRIEQSELQRYLDATNVARAVATVATTLATVAVGELATGPEQAALEAQIAGLKRVADLLQRQLDDALSQRDKWEQAFQHQAQRIALPLPQPPVQQPPRAPPGGRGGGRADMRAAANEGSSPARCCDYSSAGRRLCAHHGRHDRGAGARRHHVEQRDGEGSERARGGDGPRRALGRQYGDCPAAAPEAARALTASQWRCTAGRRLAAGAAGALAGEGRGLPRTWVRGAGRMGGLLYPGCTQAAKIERLPKKTALTKLFLSQILH